MKLTSGLLKRIIAEEAKKLGFGDMQDVEDAAKETEEVDASDYAETLEKKVDYAKALGLEERRLRQRLNRISEARSKVLKSIVKSVLSERKMTHGR